VDVQRDLARPNLTLPQFYQQCECTYLYALRVYEFDSSLGTASQLTYTFLATFFPLQRQNRAIFILKAQRLRIFFLSSNIYPLFRVPFFYLTLLTPDNIKRPPPPRHASYFAKRTINWHTLSNCVHFTTVLRPPEFRVQ
jgi:hypothetical protein